MESAPEWYRLLKAAQYLRVPPWELAAQPFYWVHVAEAAQSAEAHAEKMKAKPQPGQRHT